MSQIDLCLEAMAHLDRADDLLNRIRFHSYDRPIREVLANHGKLLGEARRHLESARAIIPSRERHDGHGARPAGDRAGRPKTTRNAA